MYRQFPMCSVILNAIRFTEKLQWTWNIYFISLYFFVWSTFCSDKYLVNYAWDMCRNTHRLYVKWLLNLSQLNEKWNSLTIFRKILQHQISWKLI
jgi:hypothetical protein